MFQLKPIITSRYRKAKTQHQITLWLNNKGKSQKFDFKLTLNKYTKKKKIIEYISLEIIGTSMVNVRLGKLF